MVQGHLAHQQLVFQEQSVFEGEDTHLILDATERFWYLQCIRLKDYRKLFLHLVGIYNASIQKSSTWSFTEQ